ncbi:MAG: polysaccharide deacetylase family protein [Clostridia bacterium]|nr:polysaccharide deacetylase family protein [Clostridia bacterium]
MGKSKILLFFCVLISTILVLVTPYKALAETDEVKVDLEDIEIQPVKVPILMYHHISDKPQNIAMVTVEKFRKDMEYLKENGYQPIFFDELYEYLQGYVELPEKPILITFDDGYQSNYNLAYPIMESLEMKFTISVIGWSVGRNTFIDSDVPITPHFSWEEAKVMYDSGLVDFQNHTYDLHSPKGKSYGAQLPVETGVLPMEEESFLDYRIRLSKDLLTLAIEMYENIGRLPNIMCYPYGVSTENSERILKTLGYIGSLKTTPGIRTYSSVSDLWEMPRINVDNYTKLETLLLKYKEIE